jgi:hypothetical protein
MFTYPDVFVLLVFNGTYYAVMYGVTASLSVIFERVYPYLSQTDLGLCFLAVGGGMFIGTSLSGKLLDAHYRKIRDDLVHQARTNSEKGADPKAIENDPSFPIEQARLHTLPYIMFVYAACVVGYGWALQSGVNIAVPLIMQIISKFFVPVSYLQFMLHDLASHQLSCSWHDCHPHHERYPDSTGGPGAQSGILHHCMCTSAFYR